jgi:hypothetical protein
VDGGRETKVGGVAARENTNDDAKSWCKQEVIDVDVKTADVDVRCVEGGVMQVV